MLNKHKLLSFIAALGLTAATAANAATMVIDSDTSFVVPTGVSSITVLAIGGGGAGAGSHWTGGGSGLLVGGVFSVVAGDNIAVTIGAGGAANPGSGNAAIGADGGTTSFGALLSAAGGIRGGSPHTCSSQPWCVGPSNANGGSGGGGGGNAGFGAAGGTGGADGVNGNTYAGGTGQGTATWTALMALITEQAVTAGTGGAASAGSHGGGGGGGGILIDALGLMGGNASHANITAGMGGAGYGAGGGSSGYASSVYGFGGSGANGVVILQYAEAAPVPLPAALPLLMAALGGLGFAARRRKTA